MGFDNVNVNVSGPVQPTSTYKTKVLKGNHSFASQVTEPNMKYVIKHDFILDGDVTIPAGCILEFDGGSLSNGTIIGQYTTIEADPIQIFNTDVIIDGTWNIHRSYPEWFGAKGDGITDSSVAINKLLNTKGFTTIQFGNGTYLCNLVLNNSVYQLHGNGGSKNNNQYSNTFLKAYNPTLPIIKIDTNSDWGRPNSQISNIAFFSSSESSAISDTTGIGIAFNYPNPEHSDSGRVLISYCMFFGFEKAIYKPQGNLGVYLENCWIRNCKYGFYAQDPSRDGLSPTEYAGLDYFFHTNFHFCEVGYVLYEKSKRAIILVNFENCTFEQNNVGLFTDTYMPNVVIKDSWLENGVNQYNNVESVTVEDYEGNELTIPSQTDIYSRNTTFIINNTRLSKIRLKGMSTFKIKDCAISSGNIVEKDEDSVLEVDGGFTYVTVPVTITTSPSNRSANPTSFGGGAYSCMVTERKGNVVDYLHTGEPIFGFVFNENVVKRINGYEGCTVVDDGLSTEKALIVTGNGANTEIRLTTYFNLKPNKFYLFSYEYKNINGSNDIRLIGETSEDRKFPRVGYNKDGSWRRIVCIFNTRAELNPSDNFSIRAMLENATTSSLAIGHAQIVEYNSYEDAYYDFFSNILYASNYCNYYQNTFNAYQSTNRRISQWTKFFSEVLGSTVFKEICRVKDYSLTGDITMKLDCMATTETTNNTNSIMERVIEFNSSDTAVVYLGDTNVTIKKEVVDGDLVVSMKGSAAIPIVGMLKIGFAKSTSSDKYKVYGNGFLLKYGDTNLPDLPKLRKGIRFLDSTGRTLTWDGSKWRYANGAYYSVLFAGEYNSKPAGNLISRGFTYFCTNRYIDPTDMSIKSQSGTGMNITYKGVVDNADVWVDCLGRVVS